MFIQRLFSFFPKILIKKNFRKDQKKKMNPQREKNNKMDCGCGQERIFPVSLNFSWLPFFPR